MGTRDIKKYNTPAVSSVPAGPTDVTQTGSILLTAGSSVYINVTTVPSSDILSIWNFLFTIVIDNLQTDSDGFYQYEFPNNQNSTHLSTGLLSTGQLKTNIQTWTDWSTSSDTVNLRNNFIIITNNDSASHTYYVFLKSYTIATNPASN